MTMGSCNACDFSIIIPLCIFRGGYYVLAPWRIFRGDCRLQSWKRNIFRICYFLTPKSRCKVRRDWLLVRFADNILCQSDPEACMELTWKVSLIEKWIEQSTSMVSNTVCCWHQGWIGQWPCLCFYACNKVNRKSLWPNDCDIRKVIVNRKSLWPNDCDIRKYCQMHDKHEMASKTVRMKSDS